MKLKIETERGWTEGIIDGDCDTSRFKKVANLLSREFNITFSDRLNNLDNLYWDFKYHGNDLVLHYNNHLGISIFPLAFEAANQLNNDSVVEISALLFQKLADLNWSDFDNGKTLGTKGSESGTIILDIENTDGARITLEKECRSIPFAITIGIYGLMFHTHYEGELEQANQFINQTKYSVNKLFEMYDVSEDKRDDFWHSKFEKLMNEIAELTENSTLEVKPAPTINLPKSRMNWWQKFFNR
jgi:hypothetical protein